MDGGTTISLRSRLIDDFNTNPDIQVFLLTTKVCCYNVTISLQLSQPAPDVRSSCFVFMLFAHHTASRPSSKVLLQGSRSFTVQGCCFMCCAGWRTGCQPDWCRSCPPL
jgi:hypothetical protein